MKHVPAMVTVFILCFGLAINAEEETKTPTSKPTQKKQEKKLKVGDVAPDFKLKGSDGKDYKLSDFKDKAGVVVAWYPKANTGG